MAYDRLIAEYLANGRVDVQPVPQQAEPTPVVDESVEKIVPEALTVAELVATYLEHCRISYRTPADGLSRWTTLCLSPRYHAAVVCPLRNGNDRISSSPRSIRAGSSN